MKALIDTILNLKAFEGYRTQIIQVLFVLYGVYKAVVAAGWLTAFVPTEWEAVLLAILAERGYAFSKEHKP